jgi:hypothetical protein
MRNVSDKSCRETQDTHFMFVTFFPKFVPFMRLSQLSKLGQNKITSL